MSDRLRYAFRVTLLAALSAVNPAAAAEEPHPFLLLLDDAGFRLDPLQLEDGQSMTLTIDRDSAVVDVVLVVGPGQSGNLVQRSVNRYTTTIERQGDTYRTTVETSARGARELPPLSIADLGAYRIRVNATAADGRKAAFVIERGLHVSRDDGPVLDMFRGLVPMAPADVSVTTETSVLGPPPAEVRGEAPLRYEGRLLFATGRIAGGPTGEFIVDFAAGTSVIARSALPDGVEIERVEAVEYSADGQRTVPSRMQGAGGEVGGYLGNARLPELAVGDLTFRDVRVGVLAELPEIVGHRPIGILGIAELMRAPVAAVTYPRQGQAGRLRLSDEPRAAPRPGIEVPFNRAGNHLFVKAEVDGVPVTFVFDTGARRTHLHPRAAEAAGLELREDDAPEGTRGLDGRRMSTRLATPRRLDLGAATFEDVTVVVADLPVFSSLGIGEQAGLLGNSFLERFSEIEVDFARQVIRLAD